MFKEAMERFHQLDHSDVRAVVDELMVGVGGVGPTPRIGESVELCLAYLSARFAKQDVVIRVRIKRRIEIDKIDTRVGEFAAIGQLLEIVSKVQAIHLGTNLEIPRLRSE